MLMKIILTIIGFSILFCGMGTAFGLGVIIFMFISAILFTLGFFDN